MFVYFGGALELSLLFIAVTQTPLSFHCLFSKLSSNFFEETTGDSGGLCSAALCPVTHLKRMTADCLTKVIFVSLTEVFWMLMPRIIPENKFNIIVAELSRLNF